MPTVSETIGATASVIDRLVDDAPESRTEPRPFRVVGIRRLRESVRRELLRLLNTRSGVAWNEWGDRPRTVLDYGVPDFTWLTPASHADRELLGSMVERCITTFEPRLERVRVLVTPAREARSVALTIEAWLAVESVNEPVSFPLVMHDGGLIISPEEEDG